MSVLAQSKAEVVVFVANHSEEVQSSLFRASIRFCLRVYQVPGEPLLELLHFLQAVQSREFKTAIVVIPKAGQMRRCVDA